jgi:hypothetical protein
MTTTVKSIHYMLDPGPGADELAEKKRAERKKRSRRLPPKRAKSTNDHSL